MEEEPRRPWMKFYPRDWRGEKSLRAVSLAARGLWIECIAIMHEAEPYGHLLLNRKPVGVDVLARMAGAPQSEVDALLLELKLAGVFSRTERGVIYSRRMVRDEKRAENGRKSVDRRWSQESESKEETTPPIRSPISTPTTQRPDTREEEKKEDASLRSASCPKPRSRPRTQSADLFDQFWKPYPRDKNMSKAQTIAEWGRLTPEEQEAAVRSVPAFVAFCRSDATYRVIHACRYLKYKRFEGFCATDDEPHVNGNQVFVEVGTTGWTAWSASMARRGKRTPKTTHAGREGWWFPSAMPPTTPEKSEDAA